MKPLFEFCFGTSDDQVWEPLSNENHEEIENTTNFIQIDWIRDQFFIYSKLFELVYAKLDIIATKLGLWKKRDFLIYSIPYWNVQKQLIQFVNGDFSSDKQLLLTSVKENGENLSLNSEFRNNYEIVKLAVSQNGNSLKYVHENLRNFKEIVKIAVEKNGESLKFASEELRNDFQVVEWAIRENGNAYLFASEELRKNKEIALLALESEPNLHSELPKCLRNDAEFIIQAISRNSQVLNRKIDITLRDRELVKQLVELNPLILELVSNELKNDREIVKIAVMKNGSSIRYASQELKDDEEIARLALDNSSSDYTTELISYRLKTNANFIGKRGHWNVPMKFMKDREILLNSIKINAFIIFGDELRRDREFILNIVSNNGMALQYAIYEFHKDREIVMAAVSQAGNAIEHAPDFWDDKEIILKTLETFSVKRIIRNEFKISERLRQDRQVLISGLKCFTSAQDFFKYFPMRRCILERELILEALDSNILPSSVLSIFNIVSAQMKVSDRMFAMGIVKLNGMVLEKMCYNHRNDLEIVSFAVKQNTKAFKFASQELQQNEEILKLIGKIN